MHKKKTYHGSFLVDRHKNGWLLSHGKSAQAENGLFPHIQTNFDLCLCRKMTVCL